MEKACTVKIAGILKQKKSVINENPYLEQSKGFTKEREWNLFWEIMNSSHKASHGVSCELTLSLQDLSWWCYGEDEHSTLYWFKLVHKQKQSLRITVVDLLVEQKGLPTFFPTPCPPIALLRRHGMQVPNPHSPPAPASHPSDREQERERHSLPPSPHFFSPPCHSCKSASITLPSMGESPITLQWVLRGRWLRLRPHAQIRAYSHLDCCFSAGLRSAYRQ